MLPIRGARTGATVTQRARAGHMAGLQARRKNGAAPSAPLRPSRALLGFAVLFVALIFALAGFIVLESRDRRLADAQRDAASLCLVLAEQTERTFESVDFLLLAVTEELRSGTSLADAAAVRELLRVRTADSPYVRAIGIFDQEGWLRHDSRYATPPAISVADRSFFAALRDPATTEPFIAEPVTSRTDGNLVLSLARRFPGRGGAFTGVVAARIEMKYFERLYAEIDRPNTRLITLVRDDGVRLVRHPHDPALMGTRIAPESPVMARLAAAPSGSFRAVSSRRHEPRIMAYQRLSHLPVHVVVAIPEATILAAWRKEATQVLGGAAVIAAILSILVALLARHLARGEKLAEALRHSEARFRDFAEATSDFFWEADETLAFTYVSEGIVHITGLSSADYLGKRFAEVVPYAAESEAAGHRALLAARRPFRGFRYSRLLPDGKVCHLSVSAKPLFDERGAFRGYRGTGRDVTKEILAEEQLRHAKAGAEAASAAKGEFLAIISHELRTPLNAIIGFSEVMANEVLGPIGMPKYREYAADIFGAGQHLLALISNILDMSKIEARKMELHEAVVDVGAVLDASLRLVQQHAADKGIALLNATSPDLPRLRGDEMRLRQVMLNLLSNALKFTPPEGEVVLRSSLDADGLELIVADRGIGMTEDEVAIALQPFRQVESAANRTQEGTGLGLPLAKALVELHGGELVIESAPGEGTTVRVRLPFERLVAQAPADQPAL